MCVLFFVFFFRLLVPLVVFKVISDTSNYCNSVCAINDFGALTLCSGIVANSVGVSSVVTFSRFREGAIYFSAFFRLVFEICVNCNEVRSSKVRRFAQLFSFVVVFVRVLFLSLLNEE